MSQVLLVGNPNSGKTTLFNALTGDSQRVGNWPGVTVEKKTGFFEIEGRSVLLTDLPGVYSLVADISGLSPDEQITVASLTGLSLDCIINVVDACNLERHLYLTSQLLELGKPVIIALNRMDVAEQLGIAIDTELLARQLGCAVVPLQAHKEIGISELLQAFRALPESASPLALELPPSVERSLADLKRKFAAEGQNKALCHYYALRQTEEDPSVVDGSTLGLDVVLADARYEKIHKVVTAVQRKHSDLSEHFTAKLDRIVLHRVFALPIFFAIMYLMFFFAIRVGGIFQDFFDLSTDILLVQGSAWLLQQVHAPNWLIALLANGLGKGINTTLVFIPVLAAMYFFLALLETSGYMARAAFVVDKIMRLMGLPGKAFVPMIVGFGCNVPAVMAARTLDSERDRLLTILMIPFMSCSARLAIYAVFVAAFFPTGGQNIVFSLYLIGILLAVFTGFLLKKTLFKGKASSLVLELPTYQKPSLKRLLKETTQRLRYFVLRAGKLIVPICVLLGGLNALSLDGSTQGAQASSLSLLSWLGQVITPIFAPMGIGQENWPAAVGLLTGVLAKEVVIGTLNSLYSQIDHAGQVAATHFDFWAGMKTAFLSIPQNLVQIFAPSLAAVVEEQTGYGMMVQRFDGQLGAFAYLLFVLLYIPCVSTMAVIRQEANSYLMWLSVTWSLVLAYSSAVAFYQIGRLLVSQQQSMLGLGLIVLALVVATGILRRMKRLHGGGNALTNL